MIRDLTNPKTLATAAAWLLACILAVGGAYVFVDQIWLPGVDTLSIDWRGNTYELLAPAWLGALVALPAFWAITRFTLSDLPTGQRWLILIVRAAVFACVVVALAQPVDTSYDDRVTTVVLVDTSASMPDAALDDARDRINAIRDAAAPDDSIELIGFAGAPYDIELPDRETPITSIPRPDEDARLQTDIAGALRRTFGEFPEDHIKRVVLLSDGNQTRGRLLEEVTRAVDFDIDIHTYTLDYEPPAEVFVNGVSGPSDMRVGEPATLTAHITSTRETTANLTVWQEEFKEDSRRLDLTAGTTSVQVDVEPAATGFQSFQFELTPGGEDTVDANNTYVWSTEIYGKPAVLYIEGDPSSRHYLQRALQSEQFRIDTRSSRGLPTKLDQLDAFDAVILSDVPASEISSNQMQLLDRYVRQLGGGLLLVGGENTFGPGGYRGTQLSDILPVSARSRDERRTPSLAMMLVIDKSGSMDGERIKLAKEAAKAAVDVLGKNDKVGVVAFDETSQTVVQMQSAVNRVRIVNDIDRLSAGGSTDIAAGLQSGFEQLALTSAKLKHIILLSDGHSEPRHIFSQLLPSMGIEDVTVSTVAVGSESATNLLRRIAERGAGRYYFTSDPYNIPQIFTQETSKVSLSSMIEEPFRVQVAKSDPVLRGIDWTNSPYLLGYVTTSPKRSAEILLQSPEGDPILARWRLGIGKVAAFTSGAKNRWAAQWLNWPGYSKFWTQLTRDTMRTDDRTRLPMHVDIEGDTAEITVDAIDRRDRFINDLSSTVTVTPPDGSDAEPRDLTLRQVAPGRYRATIRLDAYGVYRLEASHVRTGTNADDFRGVSFGTISYPYPREHQFFEPNRQLIERAASVGGGTVDPAPSALFDAGDQQIAYRRALWSYLVWLAIGLWTLDVVLRRTRFRRETTLAWRDVFG